MTTVVRQADAEASSRPGTRLRFSVPPGACDTHIHFYGPRERYPLQGTPHIPIPDATPAEFFKHQQAVNMTRAVVVNAAATGLDNRRTLDALRETPMRLRGIITPPPQPPSDSELQEWDGLGVRGVRFNYFGKPLLSMALDNTLIQRFSALGWHTQIQVSDEQVLELADRLAALPCPLVIDHMARIPAAWGVQSKAFQSLLRLIDRGNVWVKLSAPMRYSSEDRPPYADVGVMARTLVAHAPERMLWASDWPNVNYKGVMPGYDVLLDLLFDWAPDETTRKRILVDNPCRLYGFPPP